MIPLQEDVLVGLLYVEGEHVEVEDPRALVGLEAHPAKGGGRRVRRLAHGGAWSIGRAPADVT